MRLGKAAISEYLVDRYCGVSHGIDETFVEVSGLDLVKR